MNGDFKQPVMISRYYMVQICSESVDTLKRPGFGCTVTALSFDSISYTKDA